MAFFEPCHFLPAPFIEVESDAYCVHSEGAAVYVVRFQALRMHKEQASRIVTDLSQHEIDYFIFYDYYRLLKSHLIEEASD